METIFIQIAAYRDPELVPTVQDAIAQALHPSRIGFGICWQYESIDELKQIKHLKNIENCRLELVPAVQSRGLGWARSRMQKLWQGETYTLQIDSHMRFVQGWDELLLDMLATIESDKPILTAYPPAYVPPRKILHHNPTRIIPHSFRESGYLNLTHGEILSVYSTPQLGTFIAGGFMFAPAEIIQEVPHDPNIYFADEVPFSIRAWTHGWDIYHPHRPICWHYYSQGNQTKAFHWQDNKKWQELHEASDRRFRQLLEMEPRTQEFGVYDLGKVRTLQEFELLAGVDFKQRRLLHEIPEQIQEDTQPQAPLPEVDRQILLCCIRPNIDVATIEEIEYLLQEDIDWDAIIKAAPRHGIASLLYLTLKDNFPSEVPDRILGNLHQHYQKQAANNAFSLEKLLGLIALFNRANLSVVPYPDAVLATTVYSNIALRQISGVNLLVKLQDFSAAKQLLMEQEYKPTQTESENKASFSCPDSNYSINLYQRFPESCEFLPLTLESFSARLQRKSLLETKVLVPSPEDLLLMLCACGASESWERLIWMSDIAALLHSHPQLNWEQIAQQAQLLHAEQILREGLQLAQQLLSIDLPKSGF